MTRATRPGRDRRDDASGTDPRPHVLRHLRDIVLLPGVVVILVPWRLLHGDPHGWPAPTLTAAGYALGGLTFLAGLLLFARCVALFARVGRGTLAPWSPTRALVATGPYARVRNPMIAAVATMLLGQALVFGSTRVAAWLLLFVGVNHLNFVLVEEPALRRRFGDAYVEYAARVPRWIPRLRRPDRPRA